MYEDEDEGRLNTIKLGIIAVKSSTQMLKGKDFL